jgi:hypothetical protein
VGRVWLTFDTNLCCGFGLLWVTYFFGRVRWIICDCGSIGGRFGGDWLDYPGMPPGEIVIIDDSTDGMQLKGDLLRPYSHFAASVYNTRDEGLNTMEILTYGILESAMG